MNDVAFISDACVGCTKCLRICPVSAIHGNRKTLHVVDIEACTGCGFCVPVCPVDAITMGQAEARETVKIPKLSAISPQKTEIPEDILVRIRAAREKAQERHSHLGGVVKKGPPR